MAQNLTKKTDNRKPVWQSANSFIESAQKMRVGRPPDLPVWQSGNSFIASAKKPIEPWEWRLLIPGKLPIKD